MHAPRGRAGDASAPAAPHAGHSAAEGARLAHRDRGRDRGGLVQAGFEKAAGARRARAPPICTTVAQAGMAIGRPQVGVVDLSISLILNEAPTTATREARMSISALLTTAVRCWLTSLLIATSAHAENFSIVKVDARSMIMINLDSISTSPEGYRRAWIATAWSGYAPHNIYSTRDFVEYDCIGRRYRIISTMIYGRDNSRLKSIEYKEQWRRSGPKSDGFIGFNIVCNTRGLGGGLLTGDEFAIISAYRRTATKR